MSFRSRMWAISGVLLLAGSLSFWYGFAEPIRYQPRWHMRVRGDLKTLNQQKPVDANLGQWNFAVGWTWQLHCNCGEVDTAWRDGFAEELERRLQGPVGLADIEWIWDEYAKHSANGQSYSDRYRPTRDPNFAGLRDQDRYFEIPP